MDIEGNTSNSKTPRAIVTCCIVSLIMSCLLCATASYSIWHYARYSETSLKLNKNEYLPVLKYFDVNVAAKPIVAMTVLSSAAASNTCAGTVVKLGEWRGTVAGCKDKKLHKGRCTKTTGTTVKAYTSVDLNIWKGGRFCITRAISSRIKDLKAATGSECKTTETLCGCHCVSGTLCPITD